MRGGRAAGPPASFSTADNSLEAAVGEACGAVPLGHNGHDELRDWWGDWPELNRRIQGHNLALYR